MRKVNVIQRRRHLGTKSIVSIVYHARSVSEPVSKESFAACTSQCADINNSLDTRDRLGNVLAPDQERAGHLLCVRIPDSRLRVLVAAQGSTTSASLGQLD